MGGTTDLQDQKTAYERNDAPFLNIIETYIPEGTPSEEDSKEMVYDAVALDSQIQTDCSYQTFINIFNRTLNYFTTNERFSFENAIMGRKDATDFMLDISDYLRRIHPELSDSDTKTMIDKLENAIFGYYILTPLINDPKISDIKVTSPWHIRVKVHGRRMTSNLHFIDANDYWRFLFGTAIKNKTDLSNQNAVQHFTDAASDPNFILRFNICTAYVNSVPYPYLHIRKIAKNKPSIAELIHEGMMDEKVAAFLREKAKTGKGIVFTGKGGSGKTTLMNVLLDEIPFGASGLVIQESDELFSDEHPDMMFQHVVEKDGFTLKELARNGLLTDLDYFIIGEIKGGEALYFLNAAYTGHKCWCSVHSSSSTQAMTKLADYIKYESDYSLQDALHMLTNLQYVVYMKNYKVYEISEVTGWDEEHQNLQYKMIYRRDWKS